MRRTFMAAFAAAALALAAVFAVAPGETRAAGAMVDYKPGVIKDALASGKTVLVDYAASWCTTCAKQHRVLTSLRSENPAYDANIVFVRVDWDAFRRADVTTSRNVPRRSTLILLKGDEELGRIVAGTSRSSIKGLLDKGLPTS